MSLRNQALADNTLFFDSEGFTTLALFVQGENLAEVACLFTRIEETQDKMTGVHHRQTQAQMVAQIDSLPMWFSRECEVRIDTTAYRIDSLAHDYTLGRVHIWLKSKGVQSIPTGEL